MDISELKGMVLTNYKVEDAEIFLYFDLDARKFRMYHEQDCCESVTVDDICGDWADIIGRPLLVAEVVESKDNPKTPGYAESYTWTFYKLRTIKGEVVIRWYGSSNGYYSESVNLAEIAYA